tara:strand:- start:185 stop:439 length:255 start_codon:yes stop_codon:yes gene_type:complete
MFTDPGAEIDDEILMYLLIKTVKTSSVIYFICVPGMTSSPSLNNIMLHTFFYWISLGSIWFGIGIMEQLIYRGFFNDIQTLFRN